MTKRDVRLRIDGTAFEVEPNGEHHAVTLPPETEVYVNVYEHSRHYGGPEEGGWWYDLMECVQAIPCDLKGAPEIRRRLRDGEGSRFSNEGRRDIGSVLADHVYEVCIEWEAAESEELQRPHYE